MAATQAVTPLLPGGSVAEESTSLQPSAATTFLASPRKGTPAAAARAHLRSHASTSLTTAPVGGPAAVTQTVAMPPMTLRGALGFPVFQAVSPVISLGAPDDTVDVTFEADRQVISLAIIPAAGSTFQPEYRLFAPSGAELGGGAASGIAASPFGGTNESGTHVLHISAHAGMVGAFTVQVTLGAGIELEELGHPFRNDERLHAESVNAFTPIDAVSGGSIVSLLGEVSQNVTPDDDWYSFSPFIPNVGSTTIAAARLDSPGPSPALAVYDNSGALVAVGANGSVPDFTGSSLQLYYVRVSADPGTKYQLTLTRSASLETEPNDTIGTANSTQMQAGAGGKQAFLGQVQGSNVDVYRVAGTGNATMQFTTSTPGGGANALNPRLRLLSAAGVELASDDNSAADGKNATISYNPGNVPASNYYVEVSRAAGSAADGTYVLTMSGQQVTAPAFTATIASPANGSTINGGPGEIAVTFNDSVLISTLQASDLRVDNVPAGAVTVVDGATARFIVGDLLAGTHTVTIAAGAITDTQSTPVAALVSTFAIGNAAPAKPDLLAVSDTGALQTDNVTKLNNASATTALQFTVPGTVAGATVKLYAGETEIGSVVATGTSTLITTNGAAALADGSVAITARQTVLGTAQSGDSPSLTLKIDTTAPTAVATVDHAASGGNVIVTFNEPMWSGQVTTDDLAVVGMGPGAGDGPAYSLTIYDAGRNAFYYSPPTLPPDGDYRATFAAGGASDLAGNALAAGASVDFFVLRGDANGDGVVGAGDFNILASHFGQSGQTWLTGDFDGDGVVGAGDFNLLASRFGTKRGPATVAAK